MSVWKHICNRLVNCPGEGEPAENCPSFGDCSNPIGSFTLRCDTHKVWECNSCHRLFQSDLEPTICAYAQTEPCSDVTDRNYDLICDCDNE